MSAAYEELLDSIEESGVSRGEAEHAARRCALSMAKQGGAAYVGGGLLMYFLNMTPASAASYAVLALGAGAAHAVAKSPDCREVRTAVQFWNRAPF